MTGLVGVASATAAMVFMLVPGITRLHKSYGAILLGTLVASMLIPYNGMPLAAYVRSATGDLSITTLVLLWFAMMNSLLNSGMSKTGERRTILFAIAFAALALYPMALGASSFDPYRLGYGNLVFVFALLLVSLAAWLRGLHLLALCIAMSVLAWAIGWYESNNIWDYLLDPFVSIYALLAIMFYAAKSILRRKQVIELKVVTQEASGS